MAETELTPDWLFYEFFAGGGMARAGLGPEKSGYASLPMFLVCIKARRFCRNAAEFF